MYTESNPVYLLPFFAHSWGRIPTDVHDLQVLTWVENEQKWSKGNENWLFFFFK